MKMRAWTLGVAIAIIACKPAMGDDVNLPGHAISDKDAAAKAQTVFIGQVVTLDPVKPKAGQGEYLAKVIYVSRPGNGIRPAYGTMQNTSVRVGAIPSDLSFPVTMTVGANENAPMVGKEYLFYAKDNTHPGSSGYEALKLAPTGEHGLGERAF